MCGICLPVGCGACSFRRSPKPHGQPNGDQVYSTHHARAKKGLLTTLLNLSDAKLLLLACSCSARNCNTIEAGCWVTIICDVIWLPSLFHNLLTLTCLQCLSCLLSGLCNGPTLCFSIIWLGRYPGIAFSWRLKLACEAALQFLLVASLSVISQALSYVLVRNTKILIRLALSF